MTERSGSSGTVALSPRSGDAVTRVPEGCTMTAPGEATGAPTTEPGFLTEPPAAAPPGWPSREPGGRRLRRARRRRRPTGAAPPLPRSLGTTGKLWAIALVLMVAAIGILLVSAQAQRAVDVVDAAVLRAIAALRTPWLTDRGPGGRPGRHGLDLHGRGRDRPRRHGGVPALAPPVHVPRRHRRDAARRHRAVPGVLPSPPLRRRHDRAVGRVLVAVAAGRGALGGAGRRHLRHGPRGRPPGAGQADHRRGAGRRHLVPALPGRRPPLRRGGRPRHRHRHPAGRVPAVHAQRSTCRSPTGGARPPTST